ncbi:MAG: porin [Chromatiaceae bacterium]|nr:MAG: porin [Chromatiaceae bacterium]
MNKKLLNLAVATAMSAPAAVMAEATLYGRAHVSLDYVDVQSNAYWGQGISSAGAVPRSGGNPNFGNALLPSLVDANDDGIPDFPGAATFEFGSSNNFNTAENPLGDVEPAFIVEPVTFAEGATFDYVRRDGSVEHRDVGGDTVWGVAYASAVNRLQAQGVAPGIAQQVAFNEALAVAQGFASGDQITEAGRQILIGSRGQSYKGWGMNTQSRASRIGVKGSEDLGIGMKAVYQIELGVDLANENRDNNLLNNNRGAGFSLRNTFVGLAGDWGTALFGRHDTPLKISTGRLDLFADTMADFNYTVGFQDLRADNVVAYISPNFQGFSFMGAIVPAGGATGIGDFNDESDSISGAYSLAAIYSNGPFFFSAAYENLGSEMFNNSNPWRTLGLNQNTTNDDLSRAMFGRGLQDHTKWRIGLGLLDWNGFTLSGVYEQHENVNGAPRDADMDLWQIQAGYAFGNSQIMAAYGQSDVDACVAPFTFTCTSNVRTLQNRDKSSWAVGFNHNFSKRTRAYALYTALDDDSPEADWSGFSLGMMHSF